MLRTYGCGKFGDKCHDIVRRKKNIIGMWINNTLTTYEIVIGNIGSNIFYAGLEKILVLEIPRNPNIIIDVKVFHKENNTRKLLNKHRHKLAFLFSRFASYWTQASLSQNYTQKTALEILYI